MKIHTLIVVLVLIWLGPVTYAQSTGFDYHRIKNATYAVYTKYNLGDQDRIDREAVLYRLEFQKSVTHDDFSFDEYRLQQLDMAGEQIKFSHGRTIARNEGGELPVLFEICQRGNVVGLLSPQTILKKPLLFPVLSRAENLKKGDKWETLISPFLLLEDSIEKAISGNLKYKDLEPTKVSSWWTNNEEVNGYQCAKIESTFSSREFRDQGNEHSEVEFEISCHFSKEIGLPVLTIIKGNGQIKDGRNSTKRLHFYRKEILISIDP